MMICEIFFRRLSDPSYGSNNEFSLILLLDTTVWHRQHRNTYSTVTKVLNFNYLKEIMRKKYRRIPYKYILEYID